MKKTVSLVLTLLLIIGALAIPAAASAAGKDNLTVKLTSNFFPEASAVYTDLSRFEDENGDVFVTAQFKLAAPGKCLVAIDIDELTWDASVLEWQESYNYYGSGRSRVLNVFPFATENGGGAGIYSCKVNNGKGRLVANFSSVMPAMPGYKEGGLPVTAVKAVFKVLNRSAGTTTVNCNMDTVMLCDETAAIGYGQYNPISGCEINEHDYRLMTYSTSVYPPSQQKTTVTLANKSNGIRAEWQAVDGATGYIVYYREASQSQWSQAETRNTYYPLLDLTAGAQYAVQVQPVFDGEVGAYSSVSRLVYVPQVKPAIKLINKSNGIRAEWQPTAGATKYIVYYKKSGDSQWSSATTANTYYPLLHLTAGAQYAAQLQPVFGEAKGLYSSVSRLVYIPQVKPAVKLINKSNGIRAEWQSISGVSKYIVYYKKSTDSKWSSATTANTYYPLLKITAGNQYAVQVQPVFGSVKGLYSAVSRLVYIPQVKPVVTLSVKSNGIRAEWKAVEGATRYIVYYKETAASQWSSAVTANRYFPLLGLTKGVKYSVQLQPLFNNEKGLFSKVASIVY